LIHETFPTKRLDGIPYVWEEKANFAESIGIGPSPRSPVVVDL